LLKNTKEENNRGGKKMKDFVATVFLVFGIILTGADADPIIRQVVTNIIGLIFLMIFYKIMTRKPNQKGGYK